MPASFFARLKIIAVLGSAILLCSESRPSAAQDSDAKIPVVINTTLGDIRVEIDAERAPITASNFLRYVDARLYDGGSFFRTVHADNQPTDSIRIAVIQGGANRERSDESFDAIPLERTSTTGLHHVNGTISMARGGPDTATHSFFICIGDQPSLDFGGLRNPDGQGFAAFGHVISGMHIVRKIQMQTAEAQTLTPSIKILSVRRE